MRHRRGESRSEYRDRRVDRVEDLKAAGWTPVSWEGWRYVEVPAADAYRVRCPLCGKVTYDITQREYMRRHLEKKHGFSWLESFRSVFWNPDGPQSSPLKLRLAEP